MTAKQAAIDRPRSNRKGKTTRAKGRLLKFRKDVDAYLESEGKKPGKTMVGVLTELLLLRKRFKVWPPKGLS